MATRLEDEFDPSKINAPTPEYPAGSLKDETIPGVSDDGTPLISRVGNDTQGFYQSVFSRAGVTANGQPDSVTNPQILQALLSIIAQERQTSSLSNLYPLAIGTETSLQGEPYGGPGSGIIVIGYPTAEQETIYTVINGPAGGTINSISASNERVNIDGTLYTLANYVDTIGGNAGDYLGPYAAGLVFNNRTDWTIYQGQSYKLKPSVPLGFTTTGDFNVDINSLQPFDNSQRAEFQADRAEQEADNAESSAQSASNDADRAEQAVIDATLNSGVYETVADGIAATSPGDLFNVISSREYGFVDLYKNDAGVGDYQDKTSPSINLVERCTLETITTGLKKYKNLIKGDGAVSSKCSSTATATLITISEAFSIEKGLIPDDLGVYHRYSDGDNLRVHMQDSQSGMTGKTALLALMTKSPSTPVANIGVSFNGSSFLADEYGTVFLRDGVYLRWARVNSIPAGQDSGVFGVQITATDSSTYDFCPIVSIASDSNLSYLDIDVFNKNDSFTDLVDDVAANSVGEFSLAPPNNTTPVTTGIKSVTDIVQNGSTFALTDDTQSSGFIVYDFDFNPINQYVSYSIYYYYEDRARCRNPVLIFRNAGATVFPDLSLAEAVFKKTEVSPNVDRWDVTFKFYEDYGTDAGFGVQVSQKTNVGSFDVYIFGPSLNSQDEKPSYLSQVKPATFSPFWEDITGFTLFNPNKEGGALSPFQGKTAVWLGTSIPRDTNYPANVCANLGITFIDLTLGGGHLTASRYDGTFQTPTTDNQYNFTLLASEVQAEFGGNLGQEVDPNDWSILQPGSGFTLQQSDLDGLTFHNVEAVLDPIIADVDIIFMDYGINDRSNTGAPVWPNQWESAEDAGTDRRFFAGAYAWLYTRTQAANTEIQWFTITHHNRSVQQNTINVVDSQLDSARWWGHPVLNFAQTSNLNDLNLVYWTDGFRLHPPRGGFIDQKYERQITEFMKGL